MTTFLVRYLLGPLLIVEALITSLWIARHLSGMTSRDTITIVLFVTRAIVGALALVTGMWLIERRPIARALTPVVLIASAALTTLELGWRLAPSNLDPAWRWPVIIASWIYATVWIVLLRSFSVDRQE